jgi:hypothetical protein
VPEPAQPWTKCMRGTRHPSACFAMRPTAYPYRRGGRTALFEKHENRLKMHDLPAL